MEPYPIGYRSIRRTGGEDSVSRGLRQSPSLPPRRYPLLLLSSCPPRLWSRPSSEIYLHTKTVAVIADRHQTAPLPDSVLHAVHVSPVPAWPCVEVACRTLTLFGGLPMEPSRNGGQHGITHLGSKLRLKVWGGVGSRVSRTDTG